MTTPEGLRLLLQRRDLTMEDLVENADTLVRQLAPRQTRYKVSERPDARTIRYYVTQKLLPAPFGYAGGRARYGGSHLLRLLLIKRLQAEHHTLARIARVLQAATDEQVVESLLQGRDPAVATAVAVLPEGVGRRVELAPGGSVELSDEALRDPASRVRLAESLEAVARWLRSTTGKPGGDA